MFREGQRLIEKNESILQENTTFEFVALIRPCVAWVSPCAGHKLLGEDVFIALFMELLSARRSWWAAASRMPLDVGYFCSW